MAVSIQLNNHSQLQWPDILFLGSAYPGPSNSFGYAWFFNMGISAYPVVVRTSFMGNVSTPVRSVVDNKQHWEPITQLKFIPSAGTIHTRRFLSVWSAAMTRNAIDTTQPIGISSGGTATTTMATNTALPTTTDQRS